MGRVRVGVPARACSVGIRPVAAVGPLWASARGERGRLKRTLPARVEAFDALQKKQYTVPASIPTGSQGFFRPILPRCDLHSGQRGGSPVVAGTSIVAMLAAPTLSARTRNDGRLMEKRTPTHLPDPGRIGFVLLFFTPGHPFGAEKPSNEYEEKMKTGFVRAISGWFEPS